MWGGGLNDIAQDDFEFLAQYISSHQDVDRLDP